MSNKRNKLIIVIVFFCIGFIVFIVRISIIESRYDNIHNIYSPILKVDSLNNFVITKHSFNDEFRYTPNVVFITLDNNKECMIYSKLNPNFLNKGIDEILEVGDKLEKEKGSDTIYIMKKESSMKKLYYFLLK